jgi:hypothetical protein
LFDLFLKKEPVNDFAVITCFFNFSNSKLRKEAFGVFREGLKRQGAELFVVELVYGNEKPFISQGSHCSHLRTNSVMWSKENLLNILTRTLPKRIKKVAWVDGDVIFSNNDWEREASEKLQKEEVVHLCDTVENTNPSGEVDEYRMSIVKGYLRNHNNFLRTPIKPWGDKNSYHPGMGWAANRSFFTKVGLFEYDIVGGGDTTMFLTFISPIASQIGPSDSGTYREEHHSTYHGKLKAYNQKAFARVNKRLGYIDNDITHIWHGNGKGKMYGHRHQLCGDVNFDRELAKNEDGLLVWEGNRHEEKFKNLIIEQDL